MDFSELVLTRRTVHNYSPDPVPDTLVEEALRLSLWAPNHKQTWPWVYSWVGPESRERLADLAVEIKGAKEELSDTKEQAVRQNILGPSHLISLGLKRTPGKGIGTLLSPAQGTNLVFDAHREHEDYATLSCSVQIASLFLWQHGVATKWSTGGWGTHAQTYRVLGLSPDEVRLEGMLMIGKALNSPSVPQRPDLAQFLRRV